MNTNYFIRHTDSYKRDINPIEQYINQNSFYLSKMTGRSKDICYNFIKEGIKNKEFKEIEDPVVEYYFRDEQQDRTKTTTTLNKYISDVLTNKEILAPTFTTYLNPEVKESLIVGFMDYNAKARSVAKKGAQKAEAEGNINEYVRLNNEQANKKLYNNSVSGAFSDRSCSLRNPTAHSTLTSTIRIVSSISNASNEKLLAGNRHYYSPDIVLYNIISITSSLDIEYMDDIISKYKLVYPTVEDTIKTIKRSTDLYWRNDRAFINIRAFVEKLLPVERAGFVYIGDLYHLREFNPVIIKTLISKLAYKVTNVKLNNPIEIIRQTNEAVINHVHHVCINEVMGKGKDYEKMTDEVINTIAATAINVEQTIHEYSDFIKAFFLTNNLPSSTGNIQSILRRVVVVSDTDSTMFSVDEWIVWYFGKILFTPESYGVASSVMYIATNCIIHQLALFSANLGVAKDRLFTLAMKPEFTFPVFVQASVSKHYYTGVLVKEGNVFTSIKPEIKGVHLKNSALPKAVVKPATDKMLSILNDVMDGKKISLIDNINEAITKEKEVINKLKDGDLDFYKKVTIKDMSGYGGAVSSSPYVHYLFWKDVLEFKYGAINPPPYQVIKIPTTLLNRSSMKAFIESIEDKEVKDRFIKWTIAHKKDKLPRIYFSIDYVQSFGIPKEFINIIDIKSIVLELTTINRMILESLGYFVKPQQLLNEI